MEARGHPYNDECSRRHHPERRERGTGKDRALCSSKQHATVPQFLKSGERGRNRTFNPWIKSQSLAVAKSFVCFGLRVLHFRICTNFALTGRAAFCSVAFSATTSTARIAALTSSVVTIL